MDNNITFVLYFTLWFIFSLFLSRLLSAYSGKGKYLTVKNKIFSIMLIDGQKPFDKSDSTDKNRVRMSVKGFVTYIINVIVFLSFAVFLALPPMPCRHFDIFSMSADALNYAIPFYSLFILVLAQMFLYAFGLLVNNFKQKYTALSKVFIAIPLILMMCIICLCTGFMIFGIHANILL